MSERLELISSSEELHTGLKVVLHCSYCGMRQHEMMLLNQVLGEDDFDDKLWVCWDVLPPPPCLKKGQVVCFDDEIPLKRVFRVVDNLDKDADERQRKVDEATAFIKSKTERVTSR